MSVPIRFELEEASKTKLNNALSFLKKEIKKELFQSNGVHGRLSKDFRKSIISNIISQKYINSSVERKSKRYTEWKKKYGIGRGKNMWWILFGDLLKSITTWKTDDGFKSGINANIMSRGGASWLGKGDKGAPKPIAMYARILEHRQPMFHPTLNEFLPKWETEWNAALERIGKVWK